MKYNSVHFPTSCLSDRFCVVTCSPSAGLHVSSLQNSFLNKPNLFLETVTHKISASRTENDLRSDKASLNFANKARFELCFHNLSPRFQCFFFLTWRTRGLYLVHGLRVRYGGLEDVQHAVTCLVPGLQGKFLSIQDDHIL